MTLPSHRMRFSAAMFDALLLLDGSVRVASQDRSTPQSSFRSGVELVYVDVSVLDSDRRPSSRLFDGTSSTKLPGVAAATAAAMFRSRCRINLHCPFPRTTTAIFRLSRFC